MRRGIFNGLERSSSYFFLCNCLTLKVTALPSPPSSQRASFTLPRFRLRIEIKMVARLSISTTFPHIIIHFGRFARKSIRPMAYKTLQHREHTFRNVILVTLYFHMYSHCLPMLFPFSFLFCFSFLKNDKYASGESS